MTLETDTLADLIARKQQCLLGLREMGRRQRELVQRGEITLLLDLLSCKQGALFELQRIERALDPFRHQDPEGRRWRSADDRRCCAGRLAECESLLGEIVEQEKQSERELVRRRDEAAARLLGAHSASHARGAYTSSFDPHGTQLDLLSES